MPNKQPTPEKTSRLPSGQPSSTSRDQASIFALVTSCLVLSVCYWLYLGGHQGQLIEIERAAPREAKFLVDINRADWPEIIQLPGLGEILAQRVLVERETNGPFQNVDDIVRVDGIGVKTLEKIRPYLMPIPQDTDWAAAENSDKWPVQ